MNGFDVSNVPGQPGHSGSQQLPLQGYRQASNLLPIQVNGIIFLSGYFIP
jgi:hypothetical protein